MADGDLGRLVASIEARAEKFDLTLSRASQRLDRIASQTESANTRISRSHAALEAFAARSAKGLTAVVGAAAAAAGAVGYFAVRQVQALDALGDLAQQTGLTATELRRLQVGLELNGGTAEQAGEGMLTFSRNLALAEAGTGRFYAQMKKLDPAFAENVRGAGSTGEALRIVADRIAVARSEQEKLAIATAAFGPAGRQFVLLLGDGARGVDELNARLKSLGIDDLDKVTAAAQRFDDRLKLLKATVTTSFTKGLFGAGEGLESINDQLSDEKIRQMSEMSLEAGKLAANLTKLLAVTAGPIAQSFLEFMNSLFAGEGLDVASVRSEQDVDRLAQGLAKVTAEADRLEGTIARLERQTAEAPAGDVFSDDLHRSRVAQLAQARKDLEELRKIQRAFQEEVTEGRFLRPAPASGRSGAFDIAAIRAGLPAAAGPRGADSSVAKLEREREKLLRDHESFVAAMRKSTEGALTEAQKLSLQLAETLGKIGEAAQKGFISPAEAKQFQEAAIAEATGAITKAEQDALAKQQDQVNDFLREFGGATVSNAETVAEQIRDALDKIEGLSPEIRAELEKLAQAQAKLDQQKAVEGVERDLLRRQHTIESDSLFGPSEQLDRSLARAEAIAEKSELDEKIRDAYRGGDQAAMEAALARNEQLLEEQLADINSNWDEALTEIADFGEQVFGDMVQGWVQGADVNFRGIAQSFAAMLAKMAAEAAAKDIFAALRGEERGATSFVGQALNLLGGGGEKKDAEQDAARAEEAGASISSQLLGALEGGSDRLLDAGRGAGSFIVSSADAIFQAGAAAARAIAEALAAQAAGGNGGGDYFSALFGVLGSVAGGSPVPAMAEGSWIAPGGRVLRLDAALSQGGAAGAAVTALVGEGDDAETIFRLDQVPELLARSGGDASRAASLAMSLGERVSSPTIRELAAGDLVVPDRKMRPFFAQMMGEKPSVALAEGGLVSGLGSIPAAALAMPMGTGGGLTVKLEQHVAPDVKAGPLKQARGPSGEVILQQMVWRALARDLSMNGPMARRLAPDGPPGGLR